MLICRHCESKHWNGHKLVIPIKPEGSAGYKTPGAKASRRALPPCLRVSQLEADLAFALADFKFQGKRCQLRTALTAVCFLASVFRWNSRLSSE